jgi:hypothetical protein
MNSAGLLSNTANLVSAAATLISMDNNSTQPNQQTVQISISKLPPVFIELNDTLVNLRDISLIRKAKDKSKCFVIYLKQGIRCLTRDYEFNSDFLRDYSQVIAMLNSMDNNLTPSNQLNEQTPNSELLSVFMELNDTLVNLRDISLIRKGKDKSNCFVVYLKQGIRCQTEYYTYPFEFNQDYARLLAKLKSL